MSYSLLNPKSESIYFVIGYCCLKLFPLVLLNNWSNIGLFKNIGMSVIFNCLFDLTITNMIITIFL